MTQEADPRELVLVIGAGRSGTSLTAGVFNRLGFDVPQPEVEANTTNPRGFGEPRWVVNFHAKLMARYGIDLLDARPAAWDAAAQVMEDPVELGYCRTWTGWQFDEGARVVVKDPRTGWFLPMWMSCTGELGLSPALVTPLRHPTEVSSSVRTTDRDKHTDATKVAWWVNMMLHAEWQTRDARRAYLPYDDLLRDWRSAVSVAERSLDIDLISAAGEAAAKEVDDLVDPGLRRAPAGWDAVTVSSSLRDLAEATWTELLSLSRDGGDTDARRRTLDELRDAYVHSYGEAEALTESSINAARREASTAAAARTAAASDASSRSVPMARARRAAARIVRRAARRA